jgi:hypothetical protein
MNSFTRHALASVATAAVILASSAASASAQTIGTFPFALQPFCNVISLTVTLEGNTYRLAGWDDGCGATVRQPVFGTIAPNGDGTLHLGFTTIRSTGIGVETSIRNLAIGPYTGAWTDSAGNAGTAVIVGISGAPGTGGARPAPVSTIAANSITSVNIVNNSIDAVDVNSSQIQLRVTGTCPAGQAVRVVNADGSVTCGSQASSVVLGSEVSALNGITGTCEDLDSLTFANAPAGSLSCTAVVTTNFTHTNGTLDHFEYDIETTTPACGGLQRSVFEMPAEAPSSTGNDQSVTVHRWFGSIPAGPITVYLNGRTAGTSATVLASQLTCTVTQ